METLTKRPRNRKSQFNLRLDGELLDWYRKEAEKHDRPVNYVVVHAMKQFRKQQELAI